VTRGWLPQRAGLPGLNGGGAAAVVPPPGTLTHRSAPTDRQMQKTDGTGLAKVHGWLKWHKIAKK